MGRQIYVNLPVENLERTTAFFAGLGFSFDPKFTDENATCMVVDDNIFVMFLVKPFFQSFITKEISDAKKSTEVLVCLSCESREQVDDLVARAKAGGGTVAREPQDHGFMYQHGFADLDGHTWEVAYIDPTAMG